MSYFEIPSILLPNSEIDLKKWSVIACDQFTSQVEYWKQLEDIVKDSKSTLNLILPEVYLQKDNKEMVSKINDTMVSYINDGIFNIYNGFIYIEREIKKNLVRKGLMIAIDLEAYDYNPNSKTPIRATEMTVKERLPIRIEIRKDAPIELPHICIFMDDRKNLVFSELEKNKNKMKKLYDFELNMNGGNIKGFLVNDNQKIVSLINSLLDKSLLKEKYKTEDEILFVIGDGNHSLATAKECWNNIKKNLKEEQIKNHPARYALCELQNIHDNSIQFEAIHRLLKNVDESFIKYLKTRLNGERRVKIIYNNKEEFINVPLDPTIAIAKIQQVIDEYLITNKDVVIDYIHGDEYLLEVVQKENGLGIFMPTIDKNSLFDYVNHFGVMPRKSFSIGHAESKRYYLEARFVK